MEPTGAEIVTTLIMERQLDPRLALVVEGDEECALIDIHLNHAACMTVQSGSKTAVLAAARELQAAGEDWVLCLVDADFTCVEGRPDTWPPNVIHTDYYDLLMDVVLSVPHKVEGVAISHGRPGEVQRFKGTAGLDVFDRVYELILYVGALRYLVVRGEYGFSTRNWSFVGSSNLGGLSDQRARVANLASDRSGQTVDPDAIEARLQALVDETEDCNRLLNGHDFLGALAEFVRVHAGGKCGKADVAATLRVALSCAEFQSLNVVGAIRAWAAARNVESFRCAVEKAAS